jgi:hypothetical protein
MKKIAPLPLAVFLSAFSLSTPAHAYLDAGTGSMLLQLLMGGAAGVLVVGRLYWQSIKGFFRRGSESNSVMETKEDKSE